MSNLNFDPDGKGSMISVNDAVAMLTKRITSNMRPFDSETIKCNNDLVQRWQKEVLERVAVDGHLDASMVFDSWIMFHEGMMVGPYIECVKDGRIRPPTKQQAEDWAYILSDYSLSKLHALGKAAVSLGFNICDNYLKDWYAQKKWELIYSKSSDPYDWELLRPKYHTLMRGEEMDLWTKEKRDEVVQKVVALIRNNVEPEGLPGK